MARRLSAKPQPFRSCCEIENEPTVCTEGTKNCACEVVEARLVLSATAMAVPLGKAWVYCTLVMVLCVNTDASSVEVVPVPAISGLFTGDRRLSKVTVETMAGSKLPVAGLFPKTPGGETLPTPRAFEPAAVRIKSKSAKDG